MLRFCTTKSMCRNRTLTRGEGRRQDKSRKVLGGRMGRKSRNNNVRGKGAPTSITLLRATTRWKDYELHTLQLDAP